MCRTDIARRRKAANSAARGETDRAAVIGAAVLAVGAGCTGRSRLDIARRRKGANSVARGDTDRAAVTGAAVRAVGADATVGVGRT